MFLIFFTVSPCSSSSSCMPLIRAPRFLGFATAIFIAGAVGFLVGRFIQYRNPEAVAALYRAPQPLREPNEDTVAVEVYVDSNGRVLDYRVLEGPRDSWRLVATVKEPTNLHCFSSSYVCGKSHGCTYRPDFFSCPAYLDAVIHCWPAFCFRISAKFLV